MKKQEKIKEAYGDYWDECKDYIDSEGWIKVGTCHNNEPIDFEIFEIELESILEDVPFGRFIEVIETVRPKSIKGIEHNNGWHCLSEKDFPEDEITVLWYNENNGEFENASLLHCDFNFEEYTHWHELPTKAPIY